MNGYTGIKYYLGEEKKVVGYRYETFIIKNGDKLNIEQTYSGRLFCSHEKSSGIMLHNNEVGDLQDLRFQKLEYIEKYY